MAELVEEAVEIHELMQRYSHRFLLFRCLCSPPWHCRCLPGDGYSYSADLYTRRWRGRIEGGRADSWAFELSDGLYRRYDISHDVRPWKGVDHVISALGLIESLPKRKTA